MLLSLVLLIMFGFLTGYIAKRKGRDPVIWTMVGIIFGMIGTLLLLALPAYKEKSQIKEDQNDEMEINELAVFSKEDCSAKLFQTNWYYLNEKLEQNGPYAFNLLKKIWIDGKITPNSFIWTEGMTNWEKILDLPEVYNCLQSKLSK